MTISPTINSVHGRIRSITGTDPAAGTEILETVPARRRWRLLSLHFQLITNATAANRVCRLRITDGTTIICEATIVTPHTASLTRLYSFGPFGHIEQLHENSYSISLPPLLITAGYKIRTDTVNLQGTDNYSTPQFLIEEWIDP